MCREGCLQKVSRFFSFLFSFLGLVRVWGGLYDFNLGSLRWLEHCNSAELGRWT